MPRMWTPPGGQVRLRSEVGGSPVRYCRMSGLLMRPLLAAGPYGVREIGSKSGKRTRKPSAIYWFFRSRLVDRLPLPVPASCCPHLPDSFFAFRFSPFAARSGGSANPVGLLSRGQRPDHPCRPVGERHRDHLLRLACQHPGQPRIRDLAAPDRVLDDRHGSRDQEASHSRLIHECSACGVR